MWPNSNRLSFTLVSSLSKSLLDREEGDRIESGFLNGFTVLVLKLSHFDGVVSLFGIDFDSGLGLGLLSSSLSSKFKISLKKLSSGLIVFLTLSALGLGLKTGNVVFFKHFVESVDLISCNISNSYFKQILIKGIN